MEKPSRVNLRIASIEKLLHIIIITPVKDRTAYGRWRGFLHICYFRTVKNVFLLKLTWLTVWKPENHSDELINCTVNPGDMKRLALNKCIQHYHHHTNTRFCIHLFLDYYLLSGIKMIHCDDETWFWKKS